MIYSGISLLIKFLVGIFLLQGTVAILVYASLKSAQMEMWALFGMLGLIIGVLTAFWFTSIAGHHKKDALGRQRVNFTRERERILDLFERLCGARLTVSYPRIGGVRNDIPDAAWLEELKSFTEDFPARMKEYETLIDQNRIWLKRTKGIGVIGREEAINWGLSGATLRGSGIDYDIRKYMPYDAYDQVDFEVPVGEAGDVYDRYRCRMIELEQANRIIVQCIEKLPEGPFLADELKFVLPGKDEVLQDMEHLIHHFVLVAKGPKTPEGELYVSTEVPKGELGFYIVSDGTGKPYRMHVRSPSFIHASVLGRMSKGHMVADVIANIEPIQLRANF